MAADDDSPAPIGTLPAMTASMTAQRQSLGEHHRRDAAAILGPPGLAVIVFDIVQAKGDLLAEIAGAQADAMVGPGSQGNAHAALDGHGQDEAIVVVGVFADEVDAAGRLNEVRWLCCEDITKRLKQVWCAILLHLFHPQHVVSCGGLSAPQCAFRLPSNDRCGEPSH